LVVVFVVFITRLFPQSSQERDDEVIKGILV